MLQNIASKRYVKPVFRLKNMRPGIGYDQL
jgi:hypothetical protein